MQADLGHKEIRAFIQEITKNFNIDDYFENDTFMEHWNNDDVFHQLHAYVRFKNTWPDRSCNEVIKENRIEEFRTTTSKINEMIEKYINEISKDESIIPSYERQTFLYFNRVPWNWGIQVTCISKRNKSHEEKPQQWCCNKCGKKFYDPHVRHQNIGFKEQPYWEDELSCPYCDSHNIELTEDKEDEKW